MGSFWRKEDLPIKESLKDLKENLSNNVLLPESIEDGEKSEEYGMN